MRRVFADRMCPDALLRPRASYTSDKPILRLPRALFKCTDHAYAQAGRCFRFAQVSRLILSGKKSLWLWQFISFATRFLICPSCIFPKRTLAHVHIIAIHDKNCSEKWRLFACTKSKDSVQPAHPRKLIASLAQSFSGQHVHSHCWCR